MSLLVHLFFTPLFIVIVVVADITDQTVIVVAHGNDKGSLSLARVVLFLDDNVRERVEIVSTRCDFFLDLRSALLIRLTIVSVRPVLLPLLVAP